MSTANHEMPRLQVCGTGTPTGGHGLRETFKDGSIVISLGSLLAGSFGVEAAKSVMTDEAKGRPWFLAALAIGGLLVLAGFQLRARRRRSKVGIIITAADNSASARQREQQAEAFTARECALTLKAAVELPANPNSRLAVMQALVDETVNAIAMAQRLTDAGAEITIIPTMRLHNAFWFGARLGYTHAQEVAIYSIRQGTGNPPYFHATSLRDGRSNENPLVVTPPETVAGGNSARIALALDLQGRGASFHNQVLSDCRQRGVGTLLLASTPQATITEDKETFTAVVDQVCEFWRDRHPAPGGRIEDHLIYLSGPVAIAVALGARLASADQSRWTPLTYSTVTGVYETFPA